MNKWLLIGIIVVSVGLIIAGAVIRPAFITLGVGVALLALWIYLVWTVRKKKTSLFHDRMEPRSAERRLKLLKASLLVAGISLAVGIASVLVGVIVLGFEEEAVIFYIALSSVLLFIIGNVGGLVIYLTGRRKTT